MADAWKRMQDWIAKSRGQGQFHEGNGLAAGAQLKRRQKWERSSGRKVEKTYIDEKCAGIEYSYDKKKKKKRQTLKKFMACNAGNESNNQSD